MTHSNINDIGNFREIFNIDYSVNTQTGWIFFTSQCASRVLGYDKNRDLFYFVIEGINEIETVRYRNTSILYNHVHVTVKINEYVEIHFKNTTNYISLQIEFKCVQGIFESIELIDNTHTMDMIIKPFRTMLKYILRNDDIWTQPDVKLCSIIPTYRQLLTKKLDELSNFIGVDDERLYLPEIII